jgi:hypothetical protein
MNKKPQISSFSPKRLLAALGLVVFLTSLAILTLVFNHKSTVVELTVTVKQAAFAVLPPRPPETVTLLLDKTLKARSAQWKGAEALIVGVANSLADRDTIALNGGGVISVSGEEPFQPVVKLRSQTHVIIQPHRADRLMLALTQDPSLPGWQSTVEARGGLQVKLRDTPLPSKFASPANSVSDGSAVLAVASASPLLILGGRYEAEFGLHVDSPEIQPSTLLQEIDLASGIVLSTKRVPMALPQDHMILPSGNRLIVLTKQPPGESAVALFEANLNVQAPEFYRLSGFQEESFLLGGRIRFPAKEKATVEIERDFFLDVAGSEPLKLKSMRLKRGALELVLWGKPSSLKLGPTVSLMSELLPSYFIWAYTHQLGALVFTTLGWMVTASLALLKLIGWLKS